MKKNKGTKNWKGRLKKAEKIRKQAGPVLGQAQIKLELKLSFSSL